VRASGSRPDFGEALELKLAVAVGEVREHVKNDSQSLMGSLNVPRMRGLSAFTCAPLPRGCPGLARMVR